VARAWNDRTEAVAGCAWSAPRTARRPVRRPRAVRRSAVHRRRRLPGRARAAGRPVGSLHASAIGRAAAAGFIGRVPPRPGRRPASRRRRRVRRGRSRRGRRRVHARRRRLPLRRPCGAAGTFRASTSCERGPSSASVSRAAVRCKRRGSGSDRSATGRTSSRTGAAASAGATCAAFPSDRRACGAERQVSLIEQSPSSSSSSFEFLAAALRIAENGVEPRQGSPRPGCRDAQQDVVTATRSAT